MRCESGHGFLCGSPASVSLPRGVLTSAGGGERLAVAGRGGGPSRHPWWSTLLYTRARGRNRGVAPGVYARRCFRHMCEAGLPAHVCKTGLRHMCACVREKGRTFSGTSRTFFKTSRTFFKISRTFSETCAFLSCKRRRRFSSGPPLFLAGRLANRPQSAVPRNFSVEIFPRHFACPQPVVSPCAAILRVFREKKCRKSFAVKFEVRTFALAFGLSPGARSRKRFT